MKYILILLFSLTIFSCSFDNKVIDNNEDLAYYPVEVSEYFQTPGFYSNDPRFSIKDNLDKLSGPPVGGGTYAADHSSVVTLGEAGGYIILKFDPPIENHSDNIGGYDFIVFGNSFWNGGNPKYPNIEFGIVEVEYKGKWYVLIPEENRGKISRTEFVYNKSNYSDEHWTFGSKEQVTVPCWSIDSEVIYKGFADNNPTLELENNSWDFYGIPDIYDELGIDANSGGGDAFKLEWAIEPETLQPVNIDNVSKIKISTAKYYLSDYSLTPALRYQVKTTEVDAVVRVRQE